jgi:TonB family protein
MRRSFILLLALLLGIFSSIAQDLGNIANDGSDEVFNTFNPVPDTMPKFQGSDDLTSFVMWVSQNVQYPAQAKEQGISGRIIVQFVVDAQGRVAPSSIELLKGEDILFAEVARVLALSPQWEPGTFEGKPVPVMFTIPLVFSL